MQAFCQKSFNAKKRR